MKKIHIKKPDIKGALHKLKNLKKEDVKAAWKARRERRARIIEERRNSAFARKMKPVYAFMNRFSLVFHALLACIINFAIEAISRHSVFEAWNYMTGTPMVFLYNAFMIFITFPSSICSSEGYSSASSSACCGWSWAWQTDICL